MSLTLGPLFDKPMHPKPWCRFGLDRGETPDCPRLDYRITSTFTDVDLVNGGLHRAVDTGNADRGWPVLSPVNAPMRFLHHFDGARGREWDLGGAWLLSAWHVAASRNDPQRPVKGTAAGLWQMVRRGQTVALTGDTGLGTGAHTHIELKRAGIRYDPEPHLYIDGKPGDPIEGATDDMATFTDVPEGHPFYGDIEWMYEKGLTAGIPNKDGTLRYEPDAATNREQMAAFLHRLYLLIAAEFD